MGNIVDEIKSTQDKDEMLRNALIRIIQLYPEKVHFIYELLQNAEDAEAANIKFVLYDDRLEVMHDGKPFTTSDLQSLFNIGMSNKTENYNQIGEFGVGFKSVFTICESVLIYSNPANFHGTYSDSAGTFGLEMVNFYDPKKIPVVDLGKVYTTKFVFPFAIGKEYLGFESYDKLLEELKNKLENLSETTLLFMRKLEAIEYDICLSNYKNRGAYMLDKHTEDGLMRVQALSENSHEKDKDNAPELAYLLFSKYFELNGVMRSVDIAFAYTEGKNGEHEFIKAPDTNIFVYFPTGTESKLDFIVQGPYRTTPSRSEIPINAENIFLAEKTAELVYESVLKLRDAGKLNISLLNILPLREGDFYKKVSWYEKKPENLFAPVYDKVKELFRNEDIIPARCGEFINADHAILVRSSGLAEVFSDDDITNLLNSNNHLRWVSELITNTRSDMQYLYNYLTEGMGVTVVTTEYLAGQLERNSTFLKTKVSDIEWLIKLYNFFGTIPAQFSKNGKNARMLPLKLVLTERGDFVAPFRRDCNGNYLPNVFIPTDSEDIADINDIDLVNRGVYAGSKDFFDETLHLEKPDEYSIWVKAIKKRFEVPYSASEDQHIKDIKNILKYLSYPQYASDLKGILNGKLLVKCYDSNGMNWYNPYKSNVYFAEIGDGINVKEYFRNISDVAFIDEEFYENNGVKRADLKILNICDIIVEELEATTGEQYNTGKPGTKPSWHCEGKFRWLLTIKDIVKVLCYIERHSDQPDARVKSSVIFHTLLMYESCLKGDVIISGNNKPLLDELCNAINIILCKSWHDKYGKSWTNKELKSWNGKWLYTDSGELVSSIEITKYELDQGLYGTVNSRSGIYSVLKFKEDDRDKADKLNAELESLDADKQDAFIDMLLRKKFGINLEELQTKLNENVVVDDGKFADDEEDFGFPEEKVKNWELIKRHSLQLFAYAEPVLYQQKLRQIKVSGNAGAIKTYLQHTYRAQYGTRYFCQLCHKPFVRIESCQIDEPGQAEKELEPMHLSMCPNCASEFRLFRAGDDYSEFLLRIKNLKEKDIESCSPVALTTPIGDIWFTQTHIAEITELLNLQERCKDKNESGESTNYGLNVAVNSSPDIVPSKHDAKSREVMAKTSTSNGNTATGMTMSTNIIALDYLGIKNNLNKEVLYCDRKYSAQSVPKVKVRLESVNNGNVTFIYLGGLKKGERATISIRVAIANKCFETFVKP